MLAANRVVWALILCILAAVSSSSAQSDVSHCDVLITRGLREHSIQTSSEANLSAIFDDQCTSTGSTKSSGAGIGLKAIIEEIPIDLTGNYTTSEEAKSNFCRNYTSHTQSNRSSFTYEDKIMTKAYDAYNQCVMFSLSGVRVDHNPISLSETSFYLTPSVTTPIEVSGLKPSANITCQGQNPSTHQLITYGPSTHFIAKAPFNIACTRTTTETPTGLLYDEGAIQILTNISNYDVYFPPDKRLADDIASTINGRIATLEQVQKPVGETLVHGSVPPNTGVAGANVAFLTFAKADIQVNILDCLKVPNAPYKGVSSYFEAPAEGSYAIGVNAGTDVNMSGGAFAPVYGDVWIEKASNDGTDWSPMNYALFRFMSPVAFGAVSQVAYLHKGDKLAVRFSNAFNQALTVSGGFSVFRIN
jgi:hypothetical protein